MRRFAFLILLCILSISCAVLSADRMLYNKALQNAKDLDFNGAFFTLRQFLREYPDSQYASDVKFALGQYYFQGNVYYDSFNMLTDFLDHYPEHPARVFALAIVYKIIQRQTQDKASQDLDEKIRGKFFNQPLFLLFSKSRTKLYLSLLNTKFTIREYIDKIEILKNDETFLVVYP